MVAKNLLGYLFSFAVHFSATVWKLRVVIFHMYFKFTSPVSFSPIANNTFKRLHLSLVFFKTPATVEKF
jgi:hypothetical protein